MTEGGELRAAAAGDPLHAEAAEISELFSTIAFGVIKARGGEVNTISVCMTSLVTVAGALYGLLVCEGIEPDNKGRARKVADSMSRNFLEGIRLEKARQARVAREGGQVQ